jgi:hypothetical protein
MSLLQNKLFLVIICSFCLLSFGFFNQSSDEEFNTIAIASSIDHVQPMTGIVLWEELDNKETDAIQLEYSYMRYNDVVKEKGVYDWTIVERKLNSTASRSHQAVLRFWDTYPARESAVPDYIKELPDYKNIVVKSENRDTGFPDWSHPEYQRFMLEFFEKFAEKYDKDPRLAFLQVGFGLWSEYHIYDPGEILGTNFPSKEFQTKYFRHLEKLFIETPWMISQDAQLDSRTPFASQPDLLKIKFGIFDDTFHLAWEPSYNLDGWKFFGLERFKESPVGGEITFRQKERSDYVDSNWEKESRNFGITFMICEQWLRWITIDRIREHSMVCGYKFKVTEFKANDTTSLVTVENTGVAPIYYDAYIAVNKIRSTKSLKYLQPGESAQYTVNSGGQNPELTIECDRLVPGQQIDFEANLK